MRGKHRVGHRELIGLTRRVRFHDLRHTCASHLVMGTWTGEPWPIIDVSKFLRHSSVTMTERYAHLGPDHLHGRVAKLTAKAAPAPTGAPAVVAAPVAPEPVSEGAFSVPAEVSRGVTQFGSRNPSEIGSRNRYLLSHPWDLNPRPAVYETAALPLS